jgi:hypothetical protein
MQDFVTKKKDYLQTQVGNPEGADKPNKKVKSNTLGVVLGMVFLLTTKLFINSSSMTPVCGYVRVRRRCLSVSRRRARTWAMSAVCK